MIIITAIIIDNLLFISAKIVWEEVKRISNENVHKYKRLDLEKLEYKMVRTCVQQNSFKIHYH